MNKLGSAGSPGSGSFLFADPPSEDAALSEVAHTAETGPHRTAGTLTISRNAPGSAARPFLGQQPVGMDPVMVVMSDRRDDQLVGPGRVAQPFELVGHLDGGSDELGLDPIRDEFPIGVGPGVPAGLGGVGNWIAPSPVRMLRTHSP